MSSVFDSQVFAYKLSFGCSQLLKYWSSHLNKFAYLYCSEQWVIQQFKDLLQFANQPTTNTKIATTRESFTVLLHYTCDVAKTRSIPLL